METIRKPERNAFDLIIAVDDIDAVKVWAEQIECALAAVQPEYHIARAGIRHLDRNKNRFKTCEKLLFLMDIKHQTFKSPQMDSWISYFKGLKPKDIMCVLVNSDSNKFPTQKNDMEKDKCFIVETESIYDFHLWWPKMLEFLFFEMKTATKTLNYSLQTLNMHSDDQMPQRMTKCLDAFVNPNKSRTNKQCQTVKLIGNISGDANNKEHGALHLVLAYHRLEPSESHSCNSVHSRNQVLRCILFILIDAGIVPVRRFTRRELGRQMFHSSQTAARNCVKQIPDNALFCFLLSTLVFLLNIPAAITIFLGGFIGPLSYFHLVDDPECSGFFSAFVTSMFLVTPYSTVGAIVFLNIFKDRVDIIIVCVIALPLLYFLGWVTIVHFFLKRKFDCSRGIWSLQEKIWSSYTGNFFDKLPKSGQVIFIWTPIIIIHGVFVLLSFFSPTCTSLILCQNDRYKPFFKAYWDKHILASAAISITTVFLVVGYPPSYVIPIGIVFILYYVSLSLYV